MINKLLKLYRNARHNIPLEDFTTEVFAGILNMEDEVKQKFINDFLHLPNGEYEIKTQVIYPLQNKKCIIDIVLRSEDTICFIENKVESGEGNEQLDKYGQILEECRKSYKETYLLYCTKYDDKKDYSKHHFNQYRWFEVANFLKKFNTNNFIDNFITYLKTHDMAHDIVFDAKNFISLCDLQNISNKAYDCLDKLKPVFKNTFNMDQNPSDGFDFKQVRKHNRLIHYYNDIFIPESKSWSEIKYGILLFKPELYVGIWVDKGHPVYENMIQYTSKLINDFKVGIIEEGIYIELKKDMSIFLNDEEADSAITDWYILAFSSFKKMIQETSELNWKIKV